MQIDAQSKSLRAIFHWCTKSSVTSHGPIRPNILRRYEGVQYYLSELFVFEEKLWDIDDTTARSNFERIL